MFCGNKKLTLVLTGIATVAYVACVEGFVLSTIILMLFILAYTVAVCSSIFVASFTRPKRYIN